MELVAGYVKQIGSKFCIIDLKRCPAIVPEIKRGEVAVQVHLAPMPIGDDHAALDTDNTPSW